MTNKYRPVTNEKLLRGALSYLTNRGVRSAVIALLVLGIVAVVWVATQSHFNL